ncbi:hypothetical protein [Halalkalibacter sp. APA_J-10(15)]|uniref:hypothetical protein n=1 Tax=Halalkalibacter sp. APA_J-10(15) TaxID=2933805 RepID=UPI001FF5C76C|nr:hypothetical protein [Halalkalibacter sp. APA_J-10(15)]MCK0470397.1 hypothetical protein [Halalkalibacter sp. APA_J-10(15)]
MTLTKYVYILVIIREQNSTIEYIFLIVAMNDIILPTINYKNPDKECDLDYVPNHSIQAEVNYAISNGFRFGGHYTVLVFKKIKEAPSYRAECNESY